MVYIVRLLLSKNNDKPKEEKLTKQVNCMVYCYHHLLAVVVVTGGG